MAGGWSVGRALAMGDSMACEFAQGSHIGMILLHRVAHSFQLLCLHNPIPRGLHHHRWLGGFGADFECRVGACEKRGCQNMGCRANGSCQESLWWGWVGDKPQEGLRGCCALASFWGINLDGEKGVMRSCNARLWPAMMITLRVATSRLATVGLLESLAGTWKAIYGLRRRLFCLLDIRTRRQWSGFRMSLSTRSLASWSWRPWPWSTCGLHLPLSW